GERYGSRLRGGRTLNKSESRQSTQGVRIPTTRRIHRAHRWPKRSGELGRAKLCVPLAAPMGRNWDEQEARQLLASRPLHWGLRRQLDSRAGLPLLVLDVVETSFEGCS